MSGKIFINYRRGDEPGFTQALLGRLEQAFPSDQLFIDVDNIPPGEDFVRVLDAQVARCDAMLTVIGNGWLDAKDEHGVRRLDDPGDFVRIEIESALRQGKRVIPVLVHQASMPHPNNLPETLRPLATRNAVRLTHERFRADVDGLIKALQINTKEHATLRSGAAGTTGTTAPRPAAPPPSSRRAVVAAAVLTLVLAGAAGVWLATPRMPAIFPQRPPAAPSPPAPALPVQSSSLPAPAQVPSAPAPAATSPAAPAVPAESAPASAADADALRIELAFWNSIKDEKNPQLFEAYLARYPNGTFADIARIALTKLKAEPSAPPRPPPTPPRPSDDADVISDAALLGELRDRLYELNFDPGPLDGPITDATHAAIKQFQQQDNLPPTGVATMGVLRRLREAAALKPWGAIVYNTDTGKWGMAWNEANRKAAVADARVSCGEGKNCPVELSFFGSICGVFAHSSSGWALTSRDGMSAAKDAALSECNKHGKSCAVIASVCADGPRN
jgi:hypothetical protein